MIKKTPFALAHSFGPVTASRCCRTCAATLAAVASINACPLHCMAGDDVAWSTTISTEHNPGGEPGEARDIPVAIRTDESGNFYIMIVSIFPEGNGLGGPGQSFALVKLDGNGNELWRREYGTASLNTFDLVSGFGPSDRSLAIDALGRPRRAGSDWQGYSPSTGHAMAATRNAWNPDNGEHDWVDTWLPPPTAANAFENGFVLNDDGDMFAVGMSQINGCCTSDYWPYAARINADGTQVWLHSFTASDERGNNRSAALTGDGHLVAFATALNGNLRLTRYDAATGDIDWTMVHEIAGQTATFNGRMVLDGNDNFIVTGTGYGDGNERFARVFEFDENGTLLWDSTFSTDLAHPDGTNQYFHAQPHVLSDGSFIVAGQFYFPDTGWDIVIRRYAADGTVMWHEQVDATSLLGGDADERIRVMIEHPDGGVLITAHHWDEDDDQYAQSGLVLHYDIDGELLWHNQRFDPDGAAIQARGVTVAANGDVVVGYSVNDASSEGAEVLVVRYGEGESCIAADLNCDGVVNVSDLLMLLATWGACTDPNDCPADLNNDQVVDISDLLILLATWG